MTFDEMVIPIRTLWKFDYEPHPKALLGFREVGIDMDVAMAELREKYSDPEFVTRQPNPLRDYAIPQLDRLGLIGERTAPAYREMGLRA